MKEFTLTKQISKQGMQSVIIISSFLKEQLKPKTVVENGIPKTRIDPEKCSKYGGLFIDEIKRRDSQEVLQVVDGTIDVNGERGYLRVPIQGTNPQRYKSLAIIAAMNPADAEHKQALELDIAGENRFLKFRFPNCVAEAASSQLEKKVSGDLYEKFWNTFKEKTGMKGDTWKDIYSQVTDPQALQTELSGETREFIDVCLGYVGHDPIETYEHNAELIKQSGLQPHFSVRKDNEYNKILESQKTLKHGFVPRDLRKISDLSRLIGFIRSIKDGTYDPKVDLNDVAVSVGIVLESKTITGSEYGKLMSLVNNAREEYKKLHTQLNVPPEYGFRQGVWQSAVYMGQEKGFEAYINTIKQNIAAINTQAKGPAQATIKSRIMADLVVLDHFSKTYESEISKILKLPDDKIFNAFTELYDTKKSGASIYEHRLGSVMR